MNAAGSERKQPLMFCWLSRVSLSREAGKSRLSSILAAFEKKKNSRSTKRISRGTYYLHTLTPAHLIRGVSKRAYKWRVLFSLVHSAICVKIFFSLRFGLEFLLFCLERIFTHEFAFQILLDRERSDKMSVENQLSERTKDLHELQTRLEQERHLNASK